MDNVAAFDQLADITKLCKTKQVKLAFVVAPYYKECSPGKYYSNYYSLMERAKLMAE